MSKEEPFAGIRILMLGVAVAMVMIGFGTMLNAMNENPPFFDENLGMRHNYIIESDFSHWFDFTVEAGKTDEILTIVPAGVCVQDRYYHRLTLGTIGSAGTNKFFNMTLSDGTNELTLSLTGEETSGFSVTEEFAWDVSAETLSLKYSQSAGGRVTNAFVTIKYHYKENA